MTSSHARHNASFHPSVAIRLIASFVALMAGLLPARGASLSFEGIDATRQPIEVDVATSTGLDCIYVVCYSSGATAVFDAGTSGAAASTRWQRFSNLGGGFATDIQSYAQGSLSKARIEPDAPAISWNRAAVATASGW